MTRGDARTIIQEFADDAAEERWSATNLDILAGLVIDQLWADILQIEPYFTSLLETDVVVTTPGYIDIGTGGALTNRLHRVQKLTRNGREYSKAHQKDVVIEDAAKVLGPDYSYWRFGSDQLWMFPLDDTDDVELRYSYKPTQWGSLTDDNTEVPWPDGHELVYLHAVAARMLTKGDAEDPSTHETLARDGMQKMLAEIQRFGPGPIVLQASSDPVSWGSVS